MSSAAGFANSGDLPIGGDDGDDDYSRSSSSSSSSTSSRKSKDEVGGRASRNRNSSRSLARLPSDEEKEEVADDEEEDLDGVPHLQRQQQVSTIRLVQQLMDRLTSADEGELQALRPVLHQLGTQINQTEPGIPLLEERLEPRWFHGERRVFRR